MKLQPAVLRPCGYMEKYSTARHSLGLYRCVSVTGRYEVPPGTDNEELKNLLQRAVAQVVLEQPMMRVGIIDEDKQNTSFVHVAQIHLSEQIQWFGPARSDEVDASLCKHLSFQHDQPWTEMDQRPPWKVAVIPIQESEGQTTGIEVVYSFHHAINDGTSGGIFHSRLLEALLNPSADLQALEGKTLQLPRPPLLPPPQNQLVESRISWPYFMWALWDAFGPSWLKGKPSVVPWKDRPIDMSLPCETGTRIVRISAPTVAKLLLVSRAHSLTLTPLLHALVAASLARRLTVEEAPAFKSCSPISLRRYVPASSDFDSKNHMLVLVTSTDHPISSALTARLREYSDVDQENAIWDVAASVKTTMNEKLASLPDDDIGSMLKYVGNFHDFFRQKDGKERSNSWELSNLGSINGGDDGDSWRLTRAVFSQSASTVGPGFSVNVVGVAGGEVTLTLSWHASVVEAGFIDGLASDLELWTERISGSV